MNNLEDLLSPVAGLLLSTQTAEPGFIQLGTANMPCPPDTLTTGGLCLTQGLHFYNDFPVDSVSLEADKPALCHLGLLTLAVLLHPSPARVALELEHPRSTLKRLVIASDWSPQSNYPGLTLRPERFNYYPEPPRRHPWSVRNFEPTDLPILYLTNEQELVASSADLESRDTVIGFGGFCGTALIAELLLNASRPESKEVEFNLECEIGFRGVGPGSVELRIWLPGSLGNHDHEPLGT